MMPPAPKPPALIYALIAKSNQPCDQKASGQVPAQAHTILVEVTEYKGNFTRFSLECLQKLAGRVKYKCKFDCGEQTFSFLVEDGYVFHVMAEAAAGYQLPFIFLSRLRHAFHEQLGLKITAASRLISEDFRPSMLQLMRHCSDHAEEIKHQARVQQQTLEALKTVDQPLSSSLQVDEPEAVSGRQRPTQLSRAAYPCAVFCLLALLLIAVAILLAWVTSKVK